MRRFFRDLPLRRKLTVIIMATCTTALALGYAALTWRYTAAEQDKLTRRLEILASVIGANTTSAVAFKDAAWVHQHLQALDADPSVVAAFIYDEQGTLFAQFGASRRGTDGVKVSRPLELDDEVIGRIVVEGNTQQLRRALLWDAGIMCLIVTAAGLLAWALASRLQKLVSDPISRLAGTIQLVSAGKDYSRRAAPTGNDELGTLIAGFNAMLDQIQLRDERLEQHREQLVAAQRIARLGSWEWSFDTGKLHLSAEACELLGGQPVAAVLDFDQFLGLVESADRSAVRDAFTALLVQRSPLDIEHRVAMAGGRMRHLQQRAEHSADAGQQAARLTGTLQDVTERAVTQERSRIAANALENTADSVVVMDRSRRIVSVNKAFMTLSGYSEAEAIGRTPDFLCSDRHDARYDSRIWEQVLQSGHWQGEIWRRRKDGEVLPERVCISRISDDLGQIVNFVSVSHDISQLKQYEARLEHLAHHDPLTQLPNRMLFGVRVQEALQGKQGQVELVGVMFVDLDRFKTINDSLGHAVGDLVLQAAATRIARSIRHSDIVARLGGDEFAVLLNGLKSLRDARRIAGTVVQLLAQPFQVGEHKLFISASVGISCCAPGASDAETLLMNADAAMYRAKENGRNNYQFFSADMNAEAVESLVMTNNLAQALQRGEFVVHYQPRIELATRRITGVEALVRWQHPEHGLIPPARFIPLAEESGMIEPIGDWVLLTACSQARAWADAGLGPVHVAVNFSARQFRHANFTDRVSAVLRQAGLPPNRLEVEITETLMMADHEWTETVLTALKAMGVSLAMDDFGTGYSSLSYLKRFPLDRLKLDQSFVRGLPSNQHDLAITQAIAALASSLGLTLVAEGIETVEQCRILERLGCDEAQGYLFAKPMVAADMAAFLQDNCRHSLPEAEALLSLASKR